MTHWNQIARTAEIPPGEAREFVAAGRIVAVFHTEQGFFALDGICAHQGGPLGKGAVTGEVVTCPWHGWQYDVASGKHLTSPICQERFLLEVRGDEIWVQLPED